MDVAAAAWLRSVSGETWSEWLDRQETNGGYTTAQIRAARSATYRRPRLFDGQPVAGDADGSLEVTWRTEHWTLTVEIAPGGEEVWVAFTIDGSKFLVGYEMVMQVLGDG